MIDYFRALAARFRGLFRDRGADRELISAFWGKKSDPQAWDMIRSSWRECLGFNELIVAKINMLDMGQEPGIGVDCN